LRDTHCLKRSLLRKFASQWRHRHCSGFGPGNPQDDVSDV